MYILSILVLTGIALRDAVVLALSVPLIMVFLLSYLTIPGKFFEGDDIEIRMDRSLSLERSGEGEMIDVLLSLEMSPELLDRMRFATIEVEDSLPDMAEVREGNNHHVSALSDVSGNNGKILISYSVSFPQRGIYLLGPVHFRISDPFGFTVHEGIIEEVSEITVIPEVEMIKSLKLEIRRTRSIVGEIISRKKGIGTEFYGIREYTPGDELRHINWKASARTGNLMTNEYLGELSGDVTILLDARTSAMLGPPGKSTIDYGIRAAASISWNVLNTKNRVGMIVFRDTIDTVFPGYGKRQFYKLMHSLLRIKEGGKMPFHVASWAVKRFFPMKSHIVIISAANDSSIVSTVADLCSHGYDVLVISPSYIMIEAEGIPNGPEKETAIRIERMKRDAYLDELRSFTQVIDWDVREPLGTYFKGIRRVRRA